MLKKVVVIAAAGLAFVAANYVPAVNSAVSPPALAGTVTSAAENAMEGVLVSARREGSNIAVTVVSDASGRYTFPGDRLTPGPYRLRIRAAGYDLTDPGVVDVSAGSLGKVDLKLVKAHDLESQLSNVEWLLSVPGTDQQRDSLAGCLGCHSLALPLKTKFDADGWKPVLHRMRNYASPSFWLKPVKWPWQVPERPEDAKLAEYLASINLSSGTRTYALKTLPRPTGESTRVIVTEYDLPRRDSQPHDASVAPDGMVWYSDFGFPFLGCLNPRTGEIKEWRIPVARQGAIEGGLDIKFDREGNPWIGLLLQRSVARFNLKTETFTVWNIPDEWDSPRARAGMIGMAPDGTVWLKASQDKYSAHRLDPATGKIASFALPVSFYGMDSNSKGDLVLASLEDGVLGEVIAQTGKVTVYKPPTPRSGSRRGHFDAQDRFWFAEFYANKIGMFDTRTKEFREWPVPTPWSAPYDAVPDKTGQIWAGGMHTDFIYRLNPADGRITNYLLPTLAANIRRIDVDSRPNPVAVWIGANHQAKLVKIEPLP